MDTLKIAAALRALADAFEAEVSTPTEAPAAAPTTGEAPKPRGRGRPPKAAPVEAPAPAPAPAAAAPAEADPFEATPSSSIEEVRAALTKLKDATDQATAMEVLKTVGEAVNLTTLSPTRYHAVVAAATKALPAPKPAAAPVAEEDPFAVPAAAPAEEKPPTLQELKDLVIATQKRTSPETVQKIVMEHGGAAPLPTGGQGPSLKALPPENYGKAAAALKALPSTK